MRKISSFIMACAMCLSMTVVGTVAPQVAVQAEETAAVELKEAPKAPSTYKTVAGYDCQLNYGDDAEEWLSAIDKVEVNGIEYEKALLLIVYGTMRNIMLRQRLIPQIVRM